MKAGAKSSLLLIPSTLEGILVQMIKTQSKYIKIETLPFLPWLLMHSYVSGPTGPSVPSLVTALLMPIVTMQSCPVSLSHLLVTSASQNRCAPPLISS